MKDFKISTYIKPYLGSFTLAELGVFLETCIELQLPLIMAVLVDKGILYKDMDVIKEYSLYYLLLLIISILCVFLFAFSSAKAINGFSSDLRTSCFSFIYKLKLAEIHKLSLASLITRLTSDITILQDSLALVLRLGCRGPLQLFGGIIMLLFINAKFALILTITLLVLSLFVYFVMSKTKPLYKKIQENLDTLNSISQENIVGTRTIKASTGEKFEEERFDKVNAKLCLKLFRVQRLMSSLLPAFMIVMNVTLAILLYVGAFDIENNSIEIGEMMATISYLTQILFALMMLAMIFPNISKISVSYARIKEVFTLEQEENEAEQKCALEAIERIEFKDLCFNYANHGKSESNKHENAADKAVGEVADKQDEMVLDNINFHIKKGEKIALLGPTGAGKSSMVKLLFGMYEASAGNIYINDKDISCYNINEIRDNISYVLQRSDLFSTSIKENITFGDEGFEIDDLHRATSIAQAYNFINEYDEVYERKLGSKGVGISGGQRQRINLSRAFLKSTSLLILDDCTSALDLKTESEVFKAIEKRQMHNMLILISQKVISVRKMDRIYLMDKGRIVASGKHEELLLNSELYKQICLSQNIT